MILLKDIKLEDLRDLKVFVYFNLHKKLFSVKSLEGEYKGLVIAHSEKVILKDAYPRVSQNGRNRVLSEKRKNVHAGIVGNLVVESNEIKLDIIRELTYNPYSYSTFVYKSDKSEVSQEPLMYLLENKKVFEIK